MEEKTDKARSASLNHSTLLGTFCLALGGFSFLILLVMLLFSFGPLITTRGRAWEHEPVREMLIMSLIVFVVLVLLPLVAAYSLLRKRRWAKTPVIMAAIASLLVGLLSMVSAVSLGWYESLIFSVPFAALGIYAFWVVYRGPQSNKALQLTAR